MVNGNVHWEPSEELKRCLEKPQITTHELLEAILECYIFLLGKKEFSKPILAQQMKKDCIDPVKPTKESLMRLAENLDRTALDFHDSRQVRQAKNKLLSFVNKCREEAAPESISIQTESDIVVARNLGLQKAKHLGFSKIECNKIATTISELARNILQYAGAGTISMELSDKYGDESILVVARDQGPGIGNLDEIMSGSYKSKSGMGMGILGAKRLMDVFDITTGPQGTTVTVAKHKR